MATSGLAPLIARGKRALESAEWTEARDAFEAALQEEPDSPDALEGLGMAAWWLHDPPTVLGSRERAYRGYRRRDDHRAAGRIAIALAEDYRSLRGELAIARGWNRRAHRLLAPLLPSAEHGWLKIIEGDFALNDDRDPILATRRGAQALEIGLETEDIDVQLVGLALKGTSLVSQGRIHNGMSCLDEAAAAAVAGEFSNPYAVGACFRYLVSACVLVRDLARAKQWSERAEAFSCEIGFDLHFAACRVRHAEVLVWQGAWSDAERELSDVLDLAVRHYPAIADYGAARLAELRWLQGRFDEAERLLSCLADPRNALVPLARLAIDRGDARGAVRLAERFLRRIPGSNRSECLSALAVLIRACLMARDEQRANELLPTLTALARQVGTDVALGDAALAVGLCHASNGDNDAARRALEDAVDLYTISGVPHEAARARLELASVLHRLAEYDVAEREFGAGSATLETLGREAELFTTLDGRDQPISRAHRGRALTRRELEVLLHLAEGRTNPEIAARLQISHHTVKRHIANILAKLGLPSRTAAAAHAVRTGLL
jgi:LuxR family transcriptional regulator, maltose regulon positive regulatory protein